MQVISDAGKFISGRKVGAEGLLEWNEESIGGEEGR